MEAKEPGKWAIVGLHLIDVSFFGLFGVNGPIVGYLVAPSELFLIKFHVLVEPLETSRPELAIKVDGSVSEVE